MSVAEGQIPWSVPVRLDEVPESGRHVVLEAGAEVRAALAKPAGVDAIEQLTATFDLRPRGRDRLHVSGRVSATVRQTCVVTLEPLTNTIDEPVDVDFTPERGGKASDANEIDIDAHTADEPEPLVGNSIDLGVLVTEFLILGVDPYPRKPDVAFAPPAAGEASGSPFAALAALKKKGAAEE
jgi:hypothetical protein